MSEKSKSETEKQQEDFKNRVEKEFQRKIEELKKRDPFIYKNF